MEDEDRLRTNIGIGLDGIITADPARTRRLIAAIGA
jgi:hypothetical protein